VGIPGRGDSGHDAALRHAQRNFLYTGVTCGKRLVVLVGQKKAVAIAVRPTALVEAGGGLSADVSKRYVSA